MGCFFTDTGVNVTAQRGGREKLGAPRGRRGQATSSLQFALEYGRFPEQDSGQRDQV